MPDVEPVEPSKVHPSQHAGIVPSLVIAKLSWPLSCPRLGEVSPTELLAWTGATPPSDAIRRDLREQVVARLRSRAAWMWAQPTGITLPVNWQKRLCEGDARAVTKLLDKGDLAVLTLREVRNELRVPLDRVLALLARIEALDWQPRTPTRPRRRHAALQAVPTNEVRALAAQVLALPWLSKVAPDDLRFGHGDPSTSAAHWIEAQQRQPAVPGEVVARWTAMLAADQITAADEARALLDAAGAICLPRLVKDGGERWISLAMHRHLAPTGDCRTLNEVGERYALTRERVRQICRHFEEILESTPTITPALDRVLAAAARVAPCSIAEINDQLSRYIGAGAGIESLLHWARVLNKLDAPVCRQRALVRLRGKPVEVALIDAPHQHDWTRALMRHIVRDTSMFGCTNILRVAGLLSFDPGVAPGRETLEQVLESLDGFRWLDRKSGWFALGDSSNCAVATRVKKMMAVAHHHIGADEIAAALAGDDRMIYRDTGSVGLATPPVHVLRELLLSWPWLKMVQKARFIAGPQFDPTGVLSNSEAVAVMTIEAHRGVACRFELVKALDEKIGHSAMMVSIMVGSSPIFQRLEHGLYHLVGRRVQAAAVDAARVRLATQSGPLETRLALTRALQPGDTFQLRVTEAALRNEQYNVPAGFKTALAGLQMPIVLADTDRKRGLARITHAGTARGLNKAFPSAKVGDVFEIQPKDGMLKVRLLAAASDPVDPSPD